MSGGRLVKANVSYINTDCGSQTIDDSGSVVVSNAGINITSNLTFTNNDMGEPMPDSISYTDNHCGASSAPDSLTWVMTYRVSSVDAEGAVTFNITYQDATSNVGLVETEADITDQTRVLVDHTAPSLQVVRIVSSNLGKSRIAAISPKVDLPVANTGEPWNPGTNTATQGLSLIHI